MIDTAFRDLVNGIGEKLGQDAFGVQDDNCMALIDGMLVTVQCLPQINRLLILCPLLRLSSENRGSICEDLLTSHLLFSETKGATFARNAETDDIVLQQLVPLSELTSETLFLRMKAIAQTAQVFREKYKGQTNAELDYFALMQTSLRV